MFDMRKLHPLRIKAISEHQYLFLFRSAEGDKEFSFSVRQSVQETFCKSGQKGETSVNLSIARKKDNRWSYKMIAQNTSKGISWK